MSTTDLLTHWNRLSITGGDPDKLMDEKHSELEINQQKREKIYVGGAFKEVYFTWRQSQCMLLFLEGKTQREASVELGISLRTIERYTKDMCIKMKCKDKGDLINAISKTTFRVNAADVETLN
jgi:DNA-binding CsgD family transcriptional regulator